MKSMAEARANSSLGGYDDDFLDVVEDEWHCPICQLPLKEAVQTGVCGHRFCRQCLDGHFMRQEQDGQELSCPVDRNSLVREKDIFPDKATQRKILSFIIKCPSEGCQWTGELRSKDDHLESCPLKPVSCTNQNCHVSIARKDLQEHVTTTCQWRFISCTYCNTPHPSCKTETHHQECKKYPLHCPNSCGAIVAREEISSHLEKDCMLTVISCPYAQMGCTKKVQRREVESHLQSDIRLHLELACVKLHNTEVQLSNTQEELRNTQETTRRLEEKINVIGNVSRQWQQAYTWKISDFSETLRRAKRGQKPRIESAPFYTGECGYKVKILLHPNGCKSGKNTHLSLFIILMKGEYDSITPWPFRQKVTFSLIDQQEDLNDRENIVKYLSGIRVNEGWNARPLTEENSGRGSSKFLAHTKLMERRYIVDDTVFIRVEVDPQQEELSQKLLKQKRFVNLKSSTDSDSD